jgi:uncharacterized protein YkwD
MKITQTKTKALQTISKAASLSAWAIVGSLALSACGGGGSSTPTPTPTPSGTPSATPTPSGTPSATPTPVPTPVPTPTPTPTASECPIGNYKADVQAQVSAIRASARTCSAYTLDTGVVVPATFYPAAGALTWNSQLESAAAFHSNDMAANNYWGHPDANGVRVGGRASAAGYSYGSVGENIAGGQSSASQVTGDWLASGSHCANMMKASFNDIGVSCKTNPSATYVNYWTLVMGNH